MLNLKENFYSKAGFLSFTILKDFQRHRIDKVNLINCWGGPSGIPVEFRDPNPLISYLCWFLCQNAIIFYRKYSKFEAIHKDHQVQHFKWNAPTGIKPTTLVLSAPCSDHLSSSLGCPFCYLFTKEIFVMIVRPAECPILNRRFHKEYGVLFW